MLSPDDIELYDLYCRLMDRAGEGRSCQRLEIYYPPFFIELAREVQQLRKDNAQLRVSASKYFMELELNMKLQDKINLAKKELRRAGIPLNLDW